MYYKLIVNCVLFVIYIYNSFQLKLENFNLVQFSISHHLKHNVRVRNILLVITNYTSRNYNLLLDNVNFKCQVNIEL